MKQTIDAHAFREAFRMYGRHEQFCDDGLLALFEYLTDLESDTGDEMELDVIGICCDYQRFETVSEYNDAFGTDCADLVDVAEYTIVIPVGDAFIIQAY